MTEAGGHFMSVETDRVYEVVEVDTEKDAAWVKEIGDDGAIEDFLDTMLWPIPIVVLENPNYYIPVVVTPAD